MIAEKQRTFIEDIGALPISTEVCIYGRLMSIRVMGKSAFADIKDITGTVQVYATSNNLDEAVFQSFKKSNQGDMFSIKGVVFVTKTKSVAVNARAIHCLVKTELPLPSTFYGLKEIETRYRQRYVDLIMNESSQKIFLRRSQIIKMIRHFFDDQSYMEVETPILQSVASGASAKPFLTHCHALGMPLFCRIAPELYLKRLIVGGFEKIYEMGRVFRNEGLSTKHNPEFTMIEAYVAYENYEHMMSFVTALLQHIVQKLFNSHSFTYQACVLDLSHIQRIDFLDSILIHNPEMSQEGLYSIDYLKQKLSTLECDMSDIHTLAEHQCQLFDQTVESKLIQPTFIMHHPVDISPLALRHKDHPELTERFELYIHGKEIANGFSELNDPQDQLERMQKQSLKKNEDFFMSYDRDFVQALRYGLPPTAGIGIGIDRLVMLMTDSVSIKDVILFPMLKPNDSNL